jgi:TatD DNase family protein
MTAWIDTHCHLDAPEFGAQAHAIRAQAAINGVAHCVLPAVKVANFDAVRRLAHAGDDSYALGIHPLRVKAAQDSDLAHLDAQLHLHRADLRLVAVGEIGLDFFVPELCESPLRERQEFFYREQLKLARKHGLPVILHVRRSADRLLKHLREIRLRDGPTHDAPRDPVRDAALGSHAWTGIAHAFNGSDVQAREFIKLGFKLGFGGGVTYDRALALRHLATTLPLAAMVLETDAPDIPPHWLYKTAAQRAAGEPQGRNEPGELPRIGAVVAGLRGISPEALAVATTQNAMAALPRLKALLASSSAL